MAEQGAHAQSPRVVLLARAGKAAEHLADAVRQAGAELLLTVDPANTEESALRAQRPTAVLVALEPSIEPALDKLDALLSDPALTVIFDEADVAAHRSGWDAARWVRHLSAKLRNDGNVLPPGAEVEREELPSPGRLAASVKSYTDADLAAFTREAVAHADRVPVDGAPAEALRPDASLIDAIPSAPAPSAPAPAVPPPLPPVAASTLSLAPQTDAPPVPPPPAAAPAADPFAGLSLSGLSLAPTDETAAAPAAPQAIEIDATVETLSLDAYALDDMAVESVSIDSMSIEGMSLDSMSLDSVPSAAPSGAAAAFDPVAAESSVEVAPIRFDDDAFFLEELSTNAGGGAAADGIQEISLEGFDLNGFDLDEDAPAIAPPPLREPEPVISFEELVARSLAAAAAPEPVASGPAPASVPASENKPSFSFGSLSLAPVDEAPTDPAAPPAAAVAAPIAAAPIAAPPVAAAPGVARHDLSALEARISSLSLVDLDDGSAAAKPGPAFAGNGVVLIEAGLGGPDPARQLLSALPAEFPASVLVRLHLQGGRYDRLVSQMERAAAMPVALAEAGGVVNPGTIYFLPDGIGLALRG
jgi:chemotaxis response regulator CheB